MGWTQVPRFTLPWRPGPSARPSLDGSNVSRQSMSPWSANANSGKHVDDGPNWRSGSPGAKKLSSSFPSSVGSNTQFEKSFVPCWSYRFWYGKILIQLPKPVRPAGYERLLELRVRP